MRAGFRPLVTLLTAFVEYRAHALGVAGFLLIDTKELRELAATPCDEVEKCDFRVMKGWRREQLGLGLLEVMRGATLKWSDAKVALKQREKATKARFESPGTYHESVAQWFKRQGAEYHIPEPASTGSAARDAAQAAASATADAAWNNQSLLDGVGYLRVGGGRW